MPPANVPNVLTVGRILLVPVFIIALLERTETGDDVAAAVFVVASATDFVDGWLARRSEQISSFGKLADPLADKLLVGGAMVVLVHLDRLALWVAVVVIGRELAVQLARTFAARQGEVIAAAWLGKWKAAVQMLVILLLILVVPSPGWLDALVYAMVAITLWSGADYFLGMRRAMRSGDATAAT